MKAPIFQNFSEEQLKKLRELRDVKGMVRAAQERARMRELSYLSRTHKSESSNERSQA